MTTKYIVVFITGLLFSVGLSVSGMTQPHKVFGFLNIFEAWDITLIFVMVGAIATHSISYLFIKKRSSPILDKQFYLPTKQLIDFKLILGALLFGAGWALAGLCPGPALVSLATGSINIVSFVLAMIIGSVLANQFIKVKK